MTQQHAEQIPQIYERHALAWDTDRTGGAWHDKGWHDRFVACLAPAAKVLDLGCGSGMPVAFHLVQQGLRVTGVDTSPTLITLCRKLIRILYTQRGLEQAIIAFEFMAASVQPSHKSFGLAGQAED